MRSSAGSTPSTRRRSRPSPGTVRAFSVPGGPGVRVDTFAHAECTVPPYYDSLIAKIMAHGKDRQEAIARMRRTLELTVIEGIHTTIPLHLRVLAEPDFAAGRLSTAFMDRFQAEPRRPAATGLAASRLIPRGTRGPAADSRDIMPGLFAARVPNAARLPRGD